MNRQDLRLPTAFLLEAAGRVVKVYRDRVDVGARSRGCRRASRRRAGSAAGARRALRRDVLLAAAAAQLPALRPRAAGPGPRSRGGRRLRAGGAGEPERLDALPPGHAAREERRAGAGARRLRARARAAAGPRRGHNDLGALLAQAGDLDGGDRALPRGARRHARLSRRAQQPRLRAAADGPRRRGARRSTRGRSRCSPTFPRRSTTSACCSAGPATWTARSATSATRSRSATTTARRPNNLALVLVARRPGRGRDPAARGVPGQGPAFEGAYMTLAKIHLSAGRTARGLAVLERLLQRNPTHPVALELLRQFRPTMTWSDLQSRSIPR